jgi:hypothetical protein
VYRVLTLVVLVALVAAGCGGVTEIRGQPPDGGARGGSGSTDGDTGTTSTVRRNPLCPTNPPADGTPCSAEADCEYETAGDTHYCTIIAECSMSYDSRSMSTTLQWTVLAPALNCIERQAACPPAFAGTEGLSCNAASLSGPEVGRGHSCYYPEGACDCASPCFAMSPTTWSCVPWAVGCPVARPFLGDACAPEGAQCGGDCGGSAGGPLECKGGFWNMGPPAPCIACPIQ